MTDEQKPSLRESNRQISHILESITDAFFALDRQDCFTYVNRRAEELLQRPKVELLGHNVWDIFAEAVGSPFHQQYLHATSTGEAIHFEEFYPPLHKWFEVHGYPSNDGVAVHFRDITERKRAEEQIHEYAARLRALSHRLLQVQEQERRHLACELHDEIGQFLTALRFELEKLTRAPGEEGRADLEEAQSLVRELTARVRDLSLRLRPTMLDDLGLQPALLWLFERYTAQTQVRVAFEHGPLPTRLAADVETGAFRIVQEALTNVARHAKADEVVVRLWVDRDLVGVQIEDQGRGFNANNLEVGNASTGLSGMRERALLLGGRLEIETTPGVGTRVTAELPLPEAEESHRHARDTHAGR